jgi:hypothetical protein
MDSDTLSKEIRTLHWRVYCRLVRESIEKGSTINEADLIWAPVALPEHYKLNALVQYSNSIGALSLKAKFEITESIKKSGSTSYEEHLMLIVSEIKWQEC